MPLDKRKLEKLEQDLNTLYKAILLLNPEPTRSYFLLFKKQYSRYNKSNIAKSKVRSRYLKELTLIAFFKAFLSKKSPHKDFKLQYLDDYYLLPQVKISFSYIPSLNEIVDFYLEATKVIFSKDEKYFCEFYTPINMAKILIDMVDSKDLNTNTTFLDPCCGPGSLLSILLLRVAKKGYSYPKFNDFISNSIFGYDILPFSVIISILQIYTIHQYYTNNSEIPKKVNIVLKDSLQDENLAKFSYIITNPPYKKLVGSGKILHKFSKIIYGHPNMYLIFLLWALQRIGNNGHIIFLIPQTLRSGLYNHEFRKYLENGYGLEMLYLFDQKSSIFSEVEQKVMILKIRKEHCTKPISIRFYERYDGDKPTNTLDMPYSAISCKTPSTNYWQIPRNKISFSIIKKIKEKSVSVGSLKSLSVSTGNYVWNQHKVELRRKNKNGLFPLIYANSVNRYFIRFPSMDRNGGKMEYSKRLNLQPLSKPAILVKRTTTTDANGKIRASLLGQKFLKTYSTPYLENHVLYVQILRPEFKKYYKALTCYFNSTLLNYYFNTIAATNHLSTYELNSLPMSFKLINKLREDANKFFDRPEKTCLNQIDEHIYKYYGLSNKEVEEIESSIIGSKKW